MTSSICKNCYNQPVYQSLNSKATPYCSRTCAGLNGNAAKTAAAVKKLCQNCSRQPRFFDPKNQQYSPFCTRTCAGLNGKKAQAEAANKNVDLAIKKIVDVTKKIGTAIETHVGEAVTAFIDSTQSYSPSLAPMPTYATYATYTPAPSFPPMASSASKPAFESAGTFSLVSSVVPEAANVESPKSIPIINQEEVINPEAVPEQGDSINFYDLKANPEMAFIGNFFESPIKIEGFEFPCVEALYQAAKYIMPSQSLNMIYNQKVLGMFSDVSLKESTYFKNGSEIGQCAWETGQALHNLGGVQPRPDWDSVNIQVLEKILRLKYSQNPHLAESLLKIETSFFNERIDVDSSSGDGVLVNNELAGQNELLKCLVMLRDEMQKNEKVLLSVPNSLNDVLAIE